MATKNKIGEIHSTLGSKLGSYEVSSDETLVVKEFKDSSITKQKPTAISKPTAAVTATGILSDSALAKYKKQVDEMAKQINLWEKALKEAETQLNSTTGSTFKANYSVGSKAAANIQKVIDILQACKTDLKKLITAGTAFYNKHKSASKK